jgi:hypothetical protein
MLKLRKALPGVRIEAVNAGMPIERLPFFLEKDVRRTYNEKSPKTAH